MDKEEKKHLEDALHDQRPHERYNQALARTMSDQKEGKEGYKNYLELIDKVRDAAEENDCSVEDAVKRLIGKRS